MKQTISFTQEVEVRSQRFAGASIVACIKVNKHDGSLACALEVITKAMHDNSESLGEYAYGNFTEYLIDSTINSAHHEYYIQKSETPEEITLTLVRKDYAYE